MQQYQRYPQAPTFAHDYNRRARAIGIPILIAIVLWTALLNFVPVVAHAATTPGGTSPYPGTPNTTVPVVKPSNAPPLLPKHIAGVTQTGVTPPHGPTFVATTPPLTIGLQPGQSTDSISSDGTIEVTVPAGAVTTADAALPVGQAPKSLVVTQIAPPSGSVRGGIISLGTWEIQIQDGKGHEISTLKGLHQPLTVTYHSPTGHLPIDAQLMRN